jgi:phenylacetate-CoA ligase
VSSAENAGSYFDRQEVRGPADRERSIFHALPGLIRHAIDNCDFYRDALRDIDPDTVADRAALARVPVLRKSDLVALQRERKPFGGLTATPPARLARIFASPGPIYDPEGGRPDYWRFARAMFAAGFRPGDLVHNTFSYHLTPGGAMAESGARALGCPVIPAGTGQTELQLRVLNDLQPVAYVGTPSFLLTLLETGARLGLATGSLRKALLSGEPFTPAARERLARDYGIDAYQLYATADLGLIAYETSARQGLVVDEAVIVEIVEPGGSTPVPQGEVGEVVVTTFNPDYPLIRFATGDLSAILPGESPCGRTNMRLRGWLGRADQSTKVRGMFVHPHQVNEIGRRHPELARVRLEVVAGRDGHDAMRLLAEADPMPPGLRERVVETVRAVTGLRAEVELVAPGSLPGDGKVIDDRRDRG